MDARDAIPLACAIFVAVGTTACQDRLSESTDGWTAGGDTASETTPPDAVDTSCPPGERWDSASDSCVLDPDPDTHETTPDTADPAPPDTSEPDTTEPDTTTYPTAGQAFQGASAIGMSDTPVRRDHGLGLFWKNALVQFGDHVLHRYIPNQRVLDLARVTTPTGRKHFETRLPKTPPQKLHFYRNYCDKVGEETCKKEDIDDDVPTFAMAMVGLHEAPSSGKASDCTWGMIRGKTRCYFGRVITRSTTLALYAYRSFQTDQYDVFSNLKIASTTVSEGWNLVKRSGNDTRTIIPMNQQTGGTDIFTDSRLSFPMLYP